MIVWIASYPKSGNTWLRALISSYYYTKNGEFNFKLLNKIEQFPQRKFFLSFCDKFENPTSTSSYWIRAQDRINENNNLNLFKTHNALCKIGQNNFTNKENTLGCIYVIRDPRNVITSLKNHYELDYENALSFMINTRKFIHEKNINNDFGDFQFIGSWSEHYKSWTNHKLFPIKLVKYEDLLNKTFEVFIDVIEFINNLTKGSLSIDKQKVKNSIINTTFNKLQSKELNGEFNESSYSNQNKKKILFFNLGPKNQWNKLIDKNFQDKINSSFKKDLEFFDYA